MGIDATPIQNQNYCPFAPWPTGYLPDYLLGEITGIQKGAAWQPYHNEPPNGPVKMPFTDCVGYDKWETLPRLVLYWLGSDFVFWAYSTSTQKAFYCDAPVGDPFEGVNRYDNPLGVFYGGSVYIRMGLSGYTMPPSWDAAELVGVPAASGYLAEELPPTQYSRYVRYVNNSNRTNLKIIGNF